MRYFLLILTLMIVLTACGDNAEDATAEAVSEAQIRKLSGDAAVGTPRVSFAIMDGLDPLPDVTAVDVRLAPLDSEDESLIWTGTAVNYKEYEIPYWVIYPEVPAAGFWGADATITQADGNVINTQFVIEVREETNALPIGEMAPPSENRTLATEPDINKLSSGQNPNPELYQLTVAEALQTGKPTVVGFITPGLCQNRWCSYVLESVEAVRVDTREAVNYIHIEVYNDFDTLTLVPELAEWGLQTEPWVFVLDENGRITAKFEGPLSAQELSEAVLPLIQ